MKKTLSIVLCVLLVLLAVACSPETKQHEHKYEKVAEKSYAATCKSTGLDVYSCTECGDTYSVSLPLTDHSHAEDAKPIVEEGTVKADCLTTGVEIYLCEYCGETFKVVTDKDYTNHVYYDTEAKMNVNLPSSYNEKYYKWSDDIEVEATYFTPASKVAYCRSCSHATTLTEPVKGDNNYGYKNMTGTWVLSGLDEYGTIYIDVVESSEKGTTTYLNLYNPKNKLSARTKIGSINSAGFTYDANRVRTLTLENSIKLSEKDGKITISSGKQTYTLTEVGGEKVKLIENHNHKFNQTSVNSGNVSESIYKDSYFRNMDYLGSTLKDDVSHYMECDICGMKCVAVAHMDSSYDGTLDETKCSCGYWKGGKDSDGDTFKILTINKAADPKFVTYAQTSEESALEGGKAAYTAWSGMTEETDNKTAYDALVKAKSALENASTAIKYLGIENEKDETEAKLKEVEEFLDAETTGTTINDNLGLALKDLDGKSNDSTTSSAGTKYQETLKRAEELLIGIKTDATSADGASGGCTKILADAAAEAEYTELEKVAVLIGSVVSLDFESFVSSSGVEYDFAEGTGWVMSKNNSPILTNEGFKILKDNGSLNFCEKWK